jgi:ATP-dependent exoDNAse (exonuclease V) beta subunit
MKLLANRFDLDTGHLLAELPAGYDPPEVRVTADEPTDGRKSTGSSPRRRLAELLASAETWSQAGSTDPPESVSPVAPDNTARRRFSFSALSGQLHETTDDGLPGHPTEESENVMFTPHDPLRLGTLVHDVLEDVAFSGDVDIMALVRRHAQSQPGTTDAEMAEAERLVSNFLASPRTQTIAAAPRVHRELEFLLAWPPGEPRTDGFYLEGFIDCLYQDADGGWHILDYKTNVTTMDQLAHTAAAYELQMGVYALAVREVLSVEPASLTLYFLRPAAEYQFAWNDAVCRDTIEKVSRRLAEMSGRK